MIDLWLYIPHLAAMVILTCCSAFFSASEAALFYLRREDRRAMTSGGTGQRAALELLRSPERLLSAILFWNLLVNISYFAIASVVAVRLQETGHPSLAGCVAIGALLSIILVSEMLPKNVAVLRPQAIARLVGLPLAIAVRALDPVMPLLRMVNLASKRLLFPQFEAEPYLELNDIERAITLGTKDAELAEQEKNVLQNIVALSQIQVQEIMRPRLQYETFQPPISLADLAGRLTPSGYVMVTGDDGDEIVSAIPLKHLPAIPANNLQYYAEKVAYVPWSASVAAALEETRRLKRNIAVVISEHGDSIGIVTVDEMLETALHQNTSRSERILNTTSVVTLESNMWVVTGMTTLRRLRRRLGVELPASKCVTVAGVLQEQLQRLPQTDDVVQWGRCTLTVEQAPERGQLSVRVTLCKEGETPQ